MPAHDNKGKPTKPLRFVTNYGAPHPKRRRIGAACLTCRKRKTACSGEKPHCETCKQNRVDCAGYAAEGNDPKPSFPIPVKTSPIAPDRPTNLSSSPPSDHDRQTLFSGPRNRMPYFRWLGPTAIMPGFKQMVVKINQRDADGAPVDGALRISPSINLDGRPVMNYPILDLPAYDMSPVPPSQLITHLADTFFTHLACNFPFLPRERFLRDLREKRVDAMLVDAVCALAARFSTHPSLKNHLQDSDSKAGAAEYGHAFARRAKAALTEAFVLPTVAAAQAALLLAYNEFGESRDSGLWMYLGISIRLAQDLGMHKCEGLKYKGKHGPTPRYVKRQVQLQDESSEAKSNDVPPPAEPAVADVADCQLAAEQERVDTFWAIFFLDRVVSSGTGRRSTLRDSDIELSFPPLDELDEKTGWPAPFPALIRIIHLYGRVADLLNGIKEPSDVNSDTSKRLAAMEVQVTNLYQGLADRLHFDAVNFQHYVEAGQGTNFVLLHFWFHTLIVLLHQPTLLKMFKGKVLQLFPNSQQLSMSSAKTIADMLSYSQLIDAKASLGNPFTTQPIYIAACAFLRETVEQSVSNRQSRATSPSAHLTHTSDAAAAFPQEQPDSGRSSATPVKKMLARHTLLATAANQHYQLCYKALQSLERYWAGSKYILTVLDQKASGCRDPLLYTAEEREAAMEEPNKDPTFNTPSWRRNVCLMTGTGMSEIDQRFWKALPGADKAPSSGQAIGFTMTGTMNSPSTSLAVLYPPSMPPTQPLVIQQPANPSAMLDANLLLDLHTPFDATAALQQVQQKGSSHLDVYPQGQTMSHMQLSGGLHIETQDIDMTALGMDMMSWFDSTLPDELSLYDMPVPDPAFVEQPSRLQEEYQECGPRNG